jgi:hypothetical protein
VRETIIGLISASLKNCLTWLVQFHIQSDQEFHSLGFFHDNTTEPYDVRQAPMVLFP